MQYGVQNDSERILIESKGNATNGKKVLFLLILVLGVWKIAGKTLKPTWTDDVAQADEWGKWVVSGWWLVGGGCLWKSGEWVALLQETLAEKFSNWKWRRKILFENFHCQAGRVAAFVGWLTHNDIDNDLPDFVKNPQLNCEKTLGHTGGVATNIHGHIHGY